MQKLMQSVKFRCRNLIPNVNNTLTNGTKRTIDTYRRLQFRYSVTSVFSTYACNLYVRIEWRTEIRKNKPGEFR